MGATEKFVGPPTIGVVILEGSPSPTARVVQPQLAVNDQHGLAVAAARGISSIDGFR